MGKAMFRSITTTPTNADNLYTDVSDLILET